MLNSKSCWIATLSGDPMSSNPSNSVKPLEKLIHSYTKDDLPATEQDLKELENYLVDMINPLIDRINTQQEQIEQLRYLLELHQHEYGDKMQWTTKPRWSRNAD